MQDILQYTLVTAGDITLIQIKFHGNVSATEITHLAGSPHLVSDKQLVG
ncbi:MAG: hypothetical protein KKA76_17210 [Proteobacteria bacterium]|nr:hypothetical protein [Pseudomonadota bacterium]